MKKTVSLCVSTLLCLGLSLPVAAEDNGPWSHPVSGTYIPGSESATVYSVDITWGNLDFTYHGSSKGTWNPETHSYDGAIEAGWDVNTAQISVSNSSNAAVTANASYEAKPGFESADAAFTPASLSLGSADNGKGENGTGLAETGTIDITMTGSLPETATEKQISEQLRLN